MPCLVLRDFGERRSPQVWRIMKDKSLYHNELQRYSIDVVVDR